MLPREFIIAVIGKYHAENMSAHVVAQAQETVCRFTLFPSSLLLLLSFLLSPSSCQKAR